VPEVSAVQSSTASGRYAALPPFACSWRLGGRGAAWVQVAGELDLATAQQFRQVLGEAQQAARMVVLDLRELSFIDSSGIHVILDAAHHARQAGGRMLSVRGPAQVERILTLTEVCKQVSIFELAPDQATSAPPPPDPPEAA
jgi:anti-anti-sigma factor